MQTSHRQEKISSARRLKFVFTTIGRNCESNFQAYLHNLFAAACLPGSERISYLLPV